MGAITSGEPNNGDINSSGEESAATSCVSSFTIGVRGELSTLLSEQNSTLLEFMNVVGLKESAEAATLSFVK
jgi:hypothetical protein